ncbi:isopenicillin N synthase family oxygenase [Corynebacterium sp. 11A]|uniref:isopenicillin N synthase family dioxygenase n=1 Tax=Corynebacterium sp. 11A TaxID=2080510 RepID=UPI00124E7069|nr:2-oxoglutarate and iron-dependent oxygenase domain-containing protein [Corynebacterium sp. 11A]
MHTPTIPVIDFSRLRNPEHPGYEDELHALLQAAHEVGFFYLAHHGIAPRAREGLLAEAQSFFAQPAAQKRRISQIHSPHYRGYTATGTERTQGLRDWREQLDIGPELPAELEKVPEQPWKILQGPNQWPADQPELKDRALAWFAQLEQIGAGLLRAWAVAFGEEEDFFAEAFRAPHSLLKIVHYPGHDLSATRQGVGAHHDAGFITLLTVEEGSRGLQVLVDGSWVNVPAVEDYLIVNIGELLSVATGGYLKATPHRVLPSAPGTDRFSIPFFYSPALDAEVPRINLPPELRDSPTEVGVDLDGEQIYSTNGLNALKSRLRAHPDVTQKYHQYLADNFADIVDKHKKAA